MSERIGRACLCETAYAGRPGSWARLPPRRLSDRLSSSSVLHAKFVLTPRSRASPVTLAGGLTAAGSGRTTDWAAGLVSVSASAAATWDMPLAAARVVATASTARRRGVEPVLSRLPSRRPPPRAGRSIGDPDGDGAGGSPLSVLGEILISLPSVLGGHVAVSVICPAPARSFGTFTVSREDERRSGVG